MNMNLITDYHSGEYLSTEQQIAAIESSCLILQDENYLKAMYFWGRINGIQNDYFIVSGCEDDYFKSMKYFYSTNLLDWTLVPKIKPSARKSSKACNFLFTGIPSHVIEVTLPVKSSEEWRLARVNLKEEDRLAATVEMINKEAAVIPLGAFYLQPNGTAVKNSAFQGLCEAEALDPKSYIHFEDLRRDKDPFPYWNSKNTIDTDFPPESWQLQLEGGGQVAALLSLAWPGLALYQRTNSPEYQSTYFGDGRKNLDLCFATQATN